MRADHKVQQAKLEQQVLVEYLSAQMRPMARAGKLPPLEDFLKQVRPRKKHSVRDMITALQDAAARGAPIKITKVKG